MQFQFAPVSEADARSILAWRYDEPYTTYNAADDFESLERGLTEMLDRRSPYYAVRDEQGELVGFFCFGTAAQVGDDVTPGLYGEDQIMDIGLGMRPDLTGLGLGLSFVQAGLAFAREQFHPRGFRLFVLTFNERAARVYERAGFTRVRVFTQRNMHGVLTFLEMRREV